MRLSIVSLNERFDDVSQQIKSAQEAIVQLIAYLSKQTSEPLLLMSRSGDEIY